MSEPDLLAPFLDENSELSQGERLLLFVNLADRNLLRKELEKRAMMQQIGMAPESLVHSFVYSVLRIADPYAFESEDV